MFKSAIPLCLALALIPSSAFAAEDPVLVGIASAQAAEAGIGVCHGVDAAKTMKCAADQCMEQSGLGLQDCGAGLWVYPANWSDQISILHKEGISWGEFLADWNSREKLEEAIALKCKDETYAECVTIQIWDPFGKPQMTE